MGSMSLHLSTDQGMAASEMEVSGMEVSAMEWGQVLEEESMGEALSRVAAGQLAYYRHF